MFYDMALLVDEQVNSPSYVHCAAKFGCQCRMKCYTVVCRVN